MNSYLLLTDAPGRRRPPLFPRWAIHFIATPAHGDPPPEANGAGQGLEHSRGGSKVDSPLSLIHPSRQCHIFRAPATAAKACEPCAPLAPSTPTLIYQPPRASRGGRRQDSAAAKPASSSNGPTTASALGRSRICAATRCTSSWVTASIESRISS